MAFTLEHLAVEKLAMWLNASTTGSTCVDCEYYNSTHMKIRDSKNPETTERLLRVEDYELLLSGILLNKFTYEQDHTDFNGSGISLKMEMGQIEGQDSQGITMSHPSWSAEPLWFSRPEWDAFLRGVKKGKLTIAKLYKDKQRKDARNKNNKVTVHELALTKKNKKCWLRSPPQ